jgi:hypothetical protein
MANDARSSSVFTIAVVLVLGVAIGWLLRTAVGPGGNPTPTPCPTSVVVISTPTPTCIPLAAVTPGVQRVAVGPGVCNVNPECVSIKAGRDTVLWTTGVTNRDLQIEFAEELFSGMTQNSAQSYTVQCSGPQCNSGQVNPRLPTPTGGYKEYKYNQILKDPNSPTKERCDGRIIIKW